MQYQFLKDHEEALKVYFKALPIIREMEIHGFISETHLVAYKKEKEVKRNQLINIFTSIASSYSPNCK